MARRIACALLAVVLGIAALEAGGAAAQPSEARRARSFFRDGVRAAHEGRWDEAATAFRESHALSDRPQILLNLAAAEAELGHLSAAVETYRRFLREAGDRLVARHGEAARRAMAELDAALPRVTVEVQDAPAEATVVVDGAREEVRERAELRLDPGPHRLELRAGRRLVDSASVHLERGDRIDVTLHGAPAVVTSEPETPPSDPEYDPWWPWALAGGGAVVLGVVIGVVVWAAGQGGGGGFCESGGGNFDVGCWTSELLTF